MPWPRGYTRAQVAAMSPAERKEVFRRSDAKTEKQPREQQRAIPEEQSRPQRATSRSEEPAYAGMKARKPTWTMKAGNNWETASQVEENPDRYHVPQDLFPEGMDLQWCTETVYGQDMPQRMSRFYRSGWTPIHGEDFDGRFAGMFPQGDSGFIKLDGMVLCARPLSMSLAAKERDRKRARDEIALKEQAFKGGEIRATGADHPSALASNRINRTVERIDVPRDD